MNAPIKPLLMGTLLDFLYRGSHADSVPPLLRITLGQLQGAAGQVSKQAWMAPNMLHQAQLISVFERRAIRQALS